MLTVEPSGLNAQERKAASKLRLAFEEGRNRGSVSVRDRSRVQAATASNLNAANPFARIRWGNALWSEFVVYFDISKEHPFPKIQLFWVTLADIGCFTAHDAAQVRIEPFARQLRSGLGG